MKPQRTLGNVHLRTVSRISPSPARGKWPSGATGGQAIRLGRENNRREPNFLALAAADMSRSLGRFCELYAKSMGKLNTRRPGILRRRETLPARPRLQPPSVRRDSVGSTASMHEFHSDDLVAGRFRIRRLIGRGGMGEVYEAQDLAVRSSPSVALKVIRPGVSDHRKMVARFEREIEVGKTVTHPNVCRIYDLGLHFSSDSSGHNVETPFATMELLSGHTLEVELRERGPLTTGEVLPLIHQIAAALDSVHDAGIVHCDLKPGNIMLVPASGRTSLRAVLMDFGLARRIGGGGNAPGGPADAETTGGTPDYMSPEQVKGGPIEIPSDIYSFGVLIYQMITGALPFPGPNRAIRMRKRLWDDPVPLRRYIPGLDPEWETAILRCLSTDADQRFSRASDVVDMLSHADLRRNCYSREGGQCPGASGGSVTAPLGGIPCEIY